jgi:tripartite-type tricarboxylate transporter receptor subunit TctC
MKSLFQKVIAALVLAGPVAAAAQSYPERPISFVVPFAAGGATDALARQFAEHMARNAKQPIIVENISGAAGTVGAARVARARPDGYTYLIGHVVPRLKSITRQPSHSPLALATRSSPEEKVLVSQPRSWMTSAVESRTEGSSSTM